MTRLPLEFRHVRMTVFGVILAALLGASPVTTPTALACTCAPPPTEAESYLRAAAVFTGTMLKFEAVPDDDRQARIVFAVTSVEKGQLAGIVEIRTASEGGACGATLFPGFIYRLFAGRNRDGHLQISMCSLQQALFPLRSSVPALPGQPPSFPILDDLSAVDLLYGLAALALIGAGGVWFAIRRIRHRTEQS